MNKHQELPQLIYENYLKVVGITETWAKTEIPDAECNIPGYQLFNGGAMMFIAHELSLLSELISRIMGLKNLYSAIYILMTEHEHWLELYTS